MRIITPVKLMSLSLLLALATGATAVAQGGVADDSTSGHHRGSSSETTEVSSSSGTHDSSTETENETESSVNDDTTNSTNEDSASHHRATQEDHQAKLTAVKLKVCEHRQKSIATTMSRIADRGQKQLDLFTTIATKTEAFYTSKGKTLTNYQALVADVTAKQAAAKTTVDTIKADSASFSCSSTDPQASIATFKSALQSEIQALKDYKTSVKNLIVGVKSVQSTTTTSSTPEAN